MTALELQRGLHPQLAEVGEKVAHLRGARLLRCEQTLVREVSVVVGRERHRASTMRPPQRETSSFLAIFQCSAQFNDLAKLVPCEIGYAIRIRGVPCPFL